MIVLGSSFDLIDLLSLLAFQIDQMLLFRCSDPPIPPSYDSSCRDDQYGTSQHGRPYEQRLCTLQTRSSPSSSSCSRKVVVWTTKRQKTKEPASQSIHRPQEERLKSERNGSSSFTEADLCESRLNVNDFLFEAGKNGFVVGFAVAASLPRKEGTLDEGVEDAHCALMRSATWTCS